MLESAETELQSPAIATTLPGATTIRRKRGPSLSRRRGQQGNVVQKSQPWDSVALAYGRFWVDTPGVERQRKTIALGTCRTPSVAKQRLREYIEAQQINSKQTFYENTSPAITFRAASSCGFQGLMWAHDADLYDGASGVSLGDYENVIRGY